MESKCSTPHMPDLAATLTDLWGSSKLDRTIAADLICHYTLAEMLRAELTTRQALRLSNGKFLDDRRRRALRAAFAIGRLGSLLLADNNENVIRDPVGLGRGLVARYAHHVQERLIGVFLDAKNRMISEREIFIGTVNSITCSTRDIMRLAINEGAVGMILAHNHPSGDPNPSAEDLVFTRQVDEASRLMGIELQDHIIIGTGKFVSLKQRGVIR